VSADFARLDSAVKFNHRNATQASIAFFEKKIEDSVTRYEQDPTLYALYAPELDEIRERLRGDFYLYELQNMMQTSSTFLSRYCDALMGDFHTILSERQAFIQQRKERHTKTMALLTAHRESLR